MLPHVVNGVDKVVQYSRMTPWHYVWQKLWLHFNPSKRFLARQRTSLPCSTLHSALHRCWTTSGKHFEPWSMPKNAADRRSLGGGLCVSSEAVRPLRDKRNGYVPTAGESSRVKIDILRQGTPDSPLFSVQPSARLEGTKEVKAGVKFGRSPVVGGSEEIDIALEFVDPSTWETRRAPLGGDEHQAGAPTQ